MSDASALRAPAGSSVVTIGNFDGVHRGHAAVIRQAIAEGRERNLKPLVLTFAPHPAEVLGRGSVSCLTALERKVELLCRLDDELCIVVHPFTLDLARKSPAEFVQSLLVDALGAGLVMVGENFRFGNRRSGDFETLAGLGERCGFTAKTHQLEGDSEGEYSSSRIRARLLKGDVELVEQLLGRPHSVSGVVVQGDQRGRTIGVPTANLSDVIEAIPPDGVYAVAVDRCDDMTGAGTRLAVGVMNIGVRPTVGAGQSTEVHLLDFAGDLYDKKLRVHLVARLRAEQKFSGLPELKSQIAKDIEQARELLRDREPDPSASGAWY
ncbi:MAG: bifunctional riboflavin kinase/FAD synthetase [Polyangiaceae bacterium]|nr:bifunctional riboflavin kinase/FAD synthetase [Polyangiaceae bacterium]